MNDIFAGYDRLSSVGDTASFNFTTYGLGNCIAIFAQEGDKGALAHYDTIHSMPLDSPPMDDFRGLLFIEDDLRKFKEWMCRECGFKNPAFTIVLGSVWYNTADMDFQTISSVQYQNSRNFSRHNLIGVLSNVFHTEPETAAVHGGVTFTGGMIVVTPRNALPTSHDFWRGEGTEIPYHRYLS